MTSEPNRIADALTGETDWCAAAILVALHDDPATDVLPEDAGHIEQLENWGCITRFYLTPLGSRVAMVLRADGRVRPCPAHGA